MASRDVLNLGSSDAQSSPEERPGWTRFSHDYWLDTTEVTQAEFKNLTGRNPAPNSARVPSKPVVNVTWFDAVLFCNARSKRDRIDTVYQYTSASMDSTGSVWALNGLTSYLDRDGWRLPSEAEWEYAARAGSTATYAWGELADSAKAVAFAWFQRNAAASVHEVARLKPNAWGFYDMAGNVMEWVQDWKGEFPKDTLTDFVGPDAPSDVPEAPLKGGAYTYGLGHLRPSSRTATYAAYRSAKAEYVGFRCARGGFTPTYTNASGQAVQALPVSVLGTDVARLLGAQSARLVFLNRVNGKGVLSWIDYGESSPVVRSLPDKDPVFHPVISPDGNWVAWCTVMEGSTGASRIKVRRLAKNDSAVYDLGSGAIPRWWVDGTDTFLVRSGKAMDNSASDWASDRTTARRWSRGSQTGIVETWSSTGGYHDGRSGQYLYTGYRRLKQYHLSGKTSRTLFTYPQNGKSVGDTSQACNASPAPDGTGRVMFLDFGYSRKSTVVGRPYGIHEVAFVSDSLGNIVQTIPVATGKSQWDHLEWSNHPQWAVGMALEANGAYKEAHLLDLATGNTLPVVSGTDLWMPHLWISARRAVAADVASDSLGEYFVPKTGLEQDVIGDNLLRFWLSKDSAEVVLVGSSQLNGFSPAHFPHHKVVSLAWSASVHRDYDQLLRHYVLPNTPRLRVVVMTLMPGWFFSHGAWPTSRWDASLVHTPGYQYDLSNNFWTYGTSSGFRGAIQARMDARRTVLVNPVVNIPGNGWGGANPAMMPTFSEDTLQVAYQSNMALVERLIADLSARGIHVVLLHSPENPVFANLPLAGAWGPSWPAFRKIMERAKSWQRDNRFVHVYDANLDGKHDYANDEAANENHLSYRGLIKLGLRLDSLLTSIEAGP
ncbi:MAG: formylglycine-generating enzyme family protein [Fibrobacterota bacterium]